MRFRELMPSRNATEAEEVGNSKHSRLEASRKYQPTLARLGITCNLVVTDVLHFGRIGRRTPQKCNERAFFFQTYG
jgi:hypothetical protein